MVSYYLVKFKKDLTLKQNEMIMEAFNKIYEDDNNLIDFMQLTINDLME